MEYSFGIPLKNKTTVNADVSSRPKKYIKTRMEQLAEEREKCHDEHDKQWFNRCIQELEWALQMMNTPTHNCFMRPYATSPEEQKIYNVRKGMVKE
jgi:hypothetical protein